MKRPTNTWRTVSIISDQLLVRIPRRAYLFHWRLLDILCYLHHACPASAASSKNMKWVKAVDNSPNFNDQVCLGQAMSKWCIRRWWFNLRRLQPMPSFSLHPRRLQYSLAALTYGDGLLRMRCVWYASDHMLTWMYKQSEVQNANEPWTSRQPYRGAFGSNLSK